jgi:hypothetical protein
MKKLIQFRSPSTGEMKNDLPSALSCMLPGAGYQLPGFELRPYDVWKVLQVPGYMLQGNTSVGSVVIVFCIQS